jgi:D-alanine-D-alanine ligase
MAMNKPTVGVFFGSRSAEHDVSVVTATSAIIKPLELSKQFNVVPIYITKEGKWYSDPKLKDITLYTSGQISDFLAKQKPLAIQFDGGLTLLKPGLKNKTTKIDIAFPATHGTYGEDGDPSWGCLKWPTFLTWAVMSPPVFWPWTRF